MNKIIKVLVVDDSRVSQEVLLHIIQSDPGLKVVGFANNGDQALQWLQKNDCDVITMDIKMPFLNGFEVTAKVMEVKPTPIVVISSSYTTADRQMSFKALEVGALAILEKPVSVQEKEYQQQAEEIIATIKSIADIKVSKRIPQKKTLNEIKAVAIGASLGGPLAIAELLSAIPGHFPVPIFIVQHIATGFADGFARWLQEKTELQVYLAKDKEQAKAGCAYIAADSFQMEIKKGDIISLQDPLQTKLQPSVGNLFKSMAETYGSHCIGVILTGMGKDGARELLLMKEKGAATIAQDEASCLMYGMPKEAVLLGAATHVLPLQKIAPTLNSMVIGY